MVSTPATTSGSSCAQAGASQRLVATAGLPPAPPWSASGARGDEERRADYMQGKWKERYYEERYELEKGVYPLQHFAVPPGPMTIDLATPALLFPAVTLLMLAYTNRFLALASLIRGLHEKYRKDPNDIVLKQITNLRRRIYLIRDMQGLGVLAMLCCTACMFVLFAGYAGAGKVLFGVSLALLMLSLLLSVIEIRMSILALDLHLGDLEKGSQK